MFEWKSLSTYSRILTFQKNHFYLRQWKHFKNDEKCFHTQNMVEKLVPDPFIKKQNWKNLWNNSLKCFKVFFIVCLSRGLPKYIKTNVLTTCFYLIYHAFLKNKKKSRTSFPTSFLHDFWRKIFLTLCYIAWLLLLEILGNMCIVIICCPVCDVINFEINQSFLIKPFFFITKMSGQKCKYLKNEKSF